MRAYGAFIVTYALCGVLLVVVVEALQKGLA